MTLYLQTYPYRRMARRWAENHDQTLGINVQEDAERDAYILSALVPGLKSDELNIQVLEDVVRIQGEYRKQGGRWTRRMRTAISFVNCPTAPSHGPCACRSQSMPNSRGEYYGWRPDAETAQGRIRSTEADQDQIQLRNKNSRNGPRCQRHAVFLFTQNVPKV